MGKKTTLAGQIVTTANKTKKHSETVPPNFICPYMCTDLCECNRIRFDYQTLTQISSSAQQMKHAS